MHIRTSPGLLRCRMCSTRAGRFRPDPVVREGRLWGRLRELLRNEIGSWLVGVGQMRSLSSDCSTVVLDV